MVLRLENGRALRGFAGAVPIEQLKRLLGTDVVVEGVVAFRPSGDAIRLEVESISAAKAGNSIWSSMPVAEPLTSRPRLPRNETGLDAWFGKWPGDETDAQLSEALQSTGLPLVSTTKADSSGAVWAIMTSGSPPSRPCNAPWSSRPIKTSTT